MERKAILSHDAFYHRALANQIVGLMNRLVFLGQAEDENVDYEEELRLAEWKICKIRGHLRAESMQSVL